MNFKAKDAKVSWLCLKIEPMYKSGESNSTQIVATTLPPSQKQEMLSTKEDQLGTTLLYTCGKTRDRLYTWANKAAAAAMICQEAP